VDLVASATSASARGREAAYSLGERYV